MAKKRNSFRPFLEESSRCFGSWQVDRLTRSPTIHAPEPAVSRRSWERMWARHTSLVLQIHPRLWASNFPSSRLSFTCDCKQTLWKTKQKRLNFKHLPYSWVDFPLASLSKWLLTKKTYSGFMCFLHIYIYVYICIYQEKKERWWSSRTWRSTSPLRLGSSNRWWITIPGVYLK